jgi:hypothetical protein
MFGLKMAKKATLAFLILGLGLLVAAYVLMPTYAASFLLISEAEISDVRLEFERQPVTQVFQSRAVDRLFAWDTVVARGTRPRPFVEVTWRGQDGRRHAVRQVVVHEEDAPRCIHVLRLDGAAEPVPAGVLPNGPPLLIESLCR